MGFQLLIYQNRPPNDEKKTKLPNYMSKILNFSKTVLRYRRYLTHFSIFFQFFFSSAFNMFFHILKKAVIFFTTLSSDGMIERKNIFRQNWFFTDNY